MFTACEVHSYQEARSIGSEVIDASGLLAWPLHPIHHIEHIDMKWETTFLLQNGGAKIMQSSIHSASDPGHPKERTFHHEQDLVATTGRTDETCRYVTDKAANFYQVARRKLRSLKIGTALDQYRPTISRVSVCEWHRQYWKDEHEPMEWLVRRCLKFSSHHFGQQSMAVDIRSACQRRRDIRCVHFGRKPSPVTVKLISNEADFAFRTHSYRKKLDLAETLYSALDIAGLWFKTVSPPHRREKTTAPLLRHATPCAGHMPDIDGMRSFKSPVWSFPVLPRILDAGSDFTSGGGILYYMCVPSSGTCELCDVCNHCGDDGCTQCLCQPDESFNFGMNSPCCAGHSCVRCSNGSSQCVDGSAADKCYIDGGHLYNSWDTGVDASFLRSARDQGHKKSHSTSNVLFVSKTFVLTIDQRISFYDSFKYVMIKYPALTMYMQVSANEYIRIPLLNVRAAYRTKIYRPDSPKSLVTIPHNQFRALQLQKHNRCSAEFQVYSTRITLGRTRLLQCLDYSQHGASCRLTIRPLMKVVDFQKYIQANFQLTHLPAVIRWAECYALSSFDPNRSFIEDNRPRRCIGQLILPASTSLERLGSLLEGQLVREIQTGQIRIKERILDHVRTGGACFTFGIAFLVHHHMTPIVTAPIFLLGRKRDSYTRDELVGIELLTRH
ncbi:uncharacterized protein MYCFIDRAFT_175232 [Pseudocercospora fijiensis CIRAD86]|uniref:Uncharacterized protein n=1 Tax=Pseudocercospora fijiensis (strain CIRAD86) TaxID=383855 RepID=M3AW01_PSEFD|nr:uncharacterized protein MYCFIDRAFT_175232 [Pseudocercospora fijiensis CIRAD86]EME81647.1 hypothetical protein MYCFIDRAFT_175232 [Pseudocercospora fijiensis CIRAD86]